MLLIAVREEVKQRLTARQREVFVAVALNDVPIDVVADRLNTTRGAVYKTLHDARRKLRVALSAEGWASKVREHDPGHAGRAGRLVERLVGPLIRNSAARSVSTFSTPTWSCNSPVPRRPPKPGRRGCARTCRGVRPAAMITTVFSRWSWSDQTDLLTVWPARSSPGS